MTVVRLLVRPTDLMRHSSQWSVCVRLRHPHCRGHLYPYSSVTANKFFVLVLHCEVGGGRSLVNFVFSFLQLKLLFMISSYR